MKIVNKHIKICSVSHTIRELQIKTMRKYCTIIKTAELKKIIILPIDASVRNNKLFFTAGEMDIQLLCKTFGKIFAKLYKSHCGKQYGSSLKT